MADFISRRVQEVKEIDIACSCMLKPSAANYSDKGLIKAQLYNPLFNILFNTGDECCPTRYLNC